MARKRDFTADFHEITEMTNMIKGTTSLNETLSFGDSYCDEDMEGYGMEDDMCADGHCDLGKMKMDDDRSVEAKAMDTEGGSEIINQIRELTLKGMIQTCKDPSSEVYQALKRIFSYCDKAVTENAEEKEGVVKK